MASPQYVQYFGMHADMDRAFLHPGGRSATEKLLSLVPAMHQESTILELGCGAGRTAQLLLDRFPGHYVGVDASPKMLKRCWEKVSRHSHRVYLINSDMRMSAVPVASDSIDLVIAESVLAILEPRKIFRECFRLLKPAGSLIWNDRIWGNVVSGDQRGRVNFQSVKLFGFEAAPGEFTTVDDWRNLAEATGFKIIAIERIGRGNSGPDSIRELGVAKKALILGRLLLNPKHAWFYYQDRAFHRRYNALWSETEDWLFSARKK